jgi:MFS superfamily sulfate permease-like transporter
MMYEVVISLTIAIVLLPLDFSIAAELAVLAGLLTTIWQMHRRKWIT